MLDLKVISKSGKNFGASRDFFVFNKTCTESITDDIMRSMIPFWKQGDLTYRMLYLDFDKTRPEVYRYAHYCDGTYGGHCKLLFLCFAP